MPWYHIVLMDIWDLFRFLIISRIIVTGFIVIWDKIHSGSEILRES